MDNLISDLDDALIEGTCTVSGHDREALLVQRMETGIDNDDLGLLKNVVTCLKRHIKRFCSEGDITDEMEFMGNRDTSCSFLEEMTISVKEDGAKNKRKAFRRSMSGNEEGFMEKHQYGRHKKRLRVYKPRQNSAPLPLPIQQIQQQRYREKASSSSSPTLEERKREGDRNNKGKLQEQQQRRRQQQKHMETTDHQEKLSDLQLRYAQVDKESLTIEPRLSPFAHSCAMTSQQLRECGLPEHRKTDFRGLRKHHMVLDESMGFPEQ